MLAKLLARLREASTWAGVGLVVTGVGQVARINEAPQVADVLTQAGAAAVADPLVGIAVAIAGLVAIFRKG